MYIISKITTKHLIKKNYHPLKKLSNSVKRAHVDKTEREFNTVNKPKSPKPKT